MQPKWWACKREIIRRINQVPELSPEELRQTAQFVSNGYKEVTKENIELLPRPTLSAGEQMQAVDVCLLFLYRTWPLLNSKCLQTRGLSLWRITFDRWVFLWMPMLTLIYSRKHHQGFYPQKTSKAINYPLSYQRRTVATYIPLHMSDKASSGYGTTVICILIRAPKKQQRRGWGESVCVCVCVCRFCYCSSLQLYNAARQMTRVTYGELNI